MTRTNITSFQILLAQTIIKMKVDIEDLISKKYNDNIFGQLAKSTGKKDSKQTRYNIYRIIKFNYGDLAETIRKCRCDDSLLQSKKNYVFLMRKALKDLHINFRESYYPNVGSYSRLCEYIGEKNCIKNRRKFKFYYNRHRDEIVEVRCSTPIIKDIFENKDFSLDISSISPVESNNMIHGIPIVDDCINSNKMKTIILSDSDDNFSDHTGTDIPDENQIHDINNLENAKITKDSYIINSTNSHSSSHNEYCTGLNNMANSTTNKNMKNEIPKQPSSSKSELFRDVSDETEKIPAILNQNDVRPDITKILPQGSTNSKSDKWVRPSYKTCKVFEGSFIITHKELQEVWVNKKLIKGKYSYLVREKLKSVNNVCIFNVKQSRTTNPTTQF